MTQFLFDESTHEELLAAAREGFPTDHAQWLKDRLRFGRESTLRKRLRELVESTDAIGDGLSGGRPSEFVADVVNLRNDLTHVLPEADTSSEGFVSSAVMLSAKLQLLLHTRFLMDIGFAPGELRDHFDRSSWNRLLLT